MTELSSSRTEIFRQKQKTIENIRALPNDEAKLLEDTLGISFGEVKPKKIKMDIKTASHLTVDAFKRTGFRGGLANTAALIMSYNHAIASYRPALDAVMVYRTPPGGVSSSEEDRRSTLHEDIHAWQFRINEHYLNEPLEKLNRLFDSKGLVDGEFNLENAQAIVEEFLLSKIFTEGMSEFGSIYTGIKSDKITDKKTYLMRHEGRCGYEAVTSYNDDPEWSIFDFDDENYIDEVEAAFKARDELIEVVKSGNLLKFLRERSGRHDLYNLGYKLAQMIVEAGIEEGLPIGESFTRAMEKPFHRFDEIFNLEELKQMRDQPEEPELSSEKTSL